MAIDWDNIEIIAEDENIVRLTDWSNAEIISEENEYLVKTSDSDIVNVDASDRMIIFSGQPGVDGKPGPQGLAGRVMVGTTRTLPAGSQATVTNRGSDTNAILDFGIPKGEDGEGAPVWGGITGNISDQTDLTDALANKVDSADLGELATEDDAPSDNKEYVRKNGDWSEATGGIPAWGGITGTLADQTDLQSALNDKIDLPVIADEYDPSGSYSEGDIVTNNGKLYKISISEIPANLQKITAGELQLSGSLHTGDYIFYNDNLYVCIQDVQWTGSSLSDVFGWLSDPTRPFIQAVNATIYDPSAVYSIGDVVIIDNDYYECISDTITHVILTETTVDELLGYKADIQDLGDLAGKDTVDWSTDITNKPSVFPPSTHTHDDRYYTESEVDDIANAINARIDALNDFSIHVCGSGEYDPTTYTPTIQSPQENVFYLVPSGTAPDLFTEWIYVNNSWEIFGSTRIDLSNYVTNSQLTTALAGKQDTLTFDNDPTANSANPVKSGGVYSALSAKANIADLGNLAEKDSVDYDTEITNKPTLGALSALSTIDYSGNLITNKPTLGALSALNTIDYTGNLITNKPTLGTMAPVNDASSDTKAYGRKDGSWYDLDGRFYTESEIDTALALKAPLASPAFTGSPTAPTKAVSDDSTKLATTAFVQKHAPIYLTANASAGTTVTVSDSRITSTMRVTSIEFGTPSNVTSSISWVTSSGSVTFTSTFIGATVINFTIQEVN